jgi:hypothetical protein
LVSYCQILQGTYTWSEPGGLKENTIVFNKNRFVQFEFNDMDTLRGSGYYLMDGNRLLLIYDKIDKQDKSNYHLEEKVSNQQSSKTIIHLYIKNGSSNNKPIDNAIIALMHYGREIILLASDINGKANFVISDTNLVNEITIGVLGYGPLVIPVSDFRNKEVSIECVLKITKDHFFNEDRKEFSILKNSKTQLTLKLENQILNYQKTK